MSTYACKMFACVCTWRGDVSLLIRCAAPRTDSKVSRRNLEFGLSSVVWIVIWLTLRVVPFNLSQSFRSSLLPVGYPRSYGAEKHANCRCGLTRVALSLRRKARRGRRFWSGRRVLKSAFRVWQIRFKAALTRSLRWPCGGGTYAFTLGVDALTGD